MNQIQTVNLKTFLAVFLLCKYHPSKSHMTQTTGAHVPPLTIQVRVSVTFFHLKVPSQLIEISILPSMNYMSLRHTHRLSWGAFYGGHKEGKINTSDLDGFRWQPKRAKKARTFI